MNLNVDHIYICHWDKLSERKDILVKKLNDLNMSNKITWISDYDKRNWNIDDIKKDYPMIFENNPQGRKLKYSEVSIALKHMKIIKEVLKNKYENVLILEDDVEFETDFVNKFNNYFSQLPKDYDMCYIGSCCGLHTTMIPGKNVYKMNTSRCAHAYLMSRNFCEKIIDEIKNINDGVDWYYNVLIDKYNLNNYWFEPSIVSQSDKFITTIQNSELY